MTRKVLSLKQKALALNVDDRKYGSFAEIGAGQEVVRHFFQAGGAAGTIAKSTSAYDMHVSDSIYGRRENERYVSESRLLSMLKHEFNQVVANLDEVRYEDSTYFSFANTVAAKSYRRKNDCHGWLGIRFQASPKSEPCDIVVHVHMLDDDNLMQQEVIGAIGVNLIYGAFFYLDNMNDFIESLIDNIASNRVVIDMVEFFGNDVAHFDNQLANLHLVKIGATKAILFNSEGRVRQPADVLYKHPVLVQRGSFRPVTHVNLDMQECARQQFLSNPEVANDDPIILMEITLNNLEQHGELAEQDFLDRIHLLTSMGHNVLITNYARHYHFANYLARQCKKPFALVIGIHNLEETLKDEYYEDLDGGILEAFGKLFSRNGKLYIYPKFNEQNKLCLAKNLTVAKHLKHLYEYFLENEFIVDLTNCDESKLSIFSHEVLHMMQHGDAGWEQYVPEQVAMYIKQHHLWERPDS